MKDKTIGEFIKVLVDAGIINAKTVKGGKQTVYSWIRRGIIKPRRRPHSKWYVFNDEEIADIVDALSSEGSGKWSYNSNETTNQIN